MTMPTIEARQRHAHRINGKFAPRPDSAVTRLEPPPIGRMPRTPDKLSDDAWRQGDTLRISPTTDALERAMLDDDIIIPAPPVQWQTTPDRDWFSWRDWEWRDLWAVAFVGVVLAFASHIAGVWGA